MGPGRPGAQVQQLGALHRCSPHACPSRCLPRPPQCNLAFDRVSLKGAGRKGGGGMGTTIGLGLPMAMLGGGPPGFL